MGCRKGEKWALDKLHQPWNFSWLKMAFGKFTGK